MFKVSDKKFHELYAVAIDNIAEPYASKAQNIAFLVEDQPSQEQRTHHKLQPWQTLFGLYEGTPLPRRGGGTKVLPDKITLFKQPLEAASSSLEELKENIKHTLWHELAHYFGLDHGRISELER